MDCREAVYMRRRMKVSTNFAGVGANLPAYNLVVYSYTVNHRNLWESFPCDSYHNKSLGIAT